jgi:hypothetical protein
MFNVDEGGTVEKTIKARFSNGVIEPLEDLTISAHNRTSMHCQR